MDAEIRKFIAEHGSESASTLLLRYAGKNLPFSLENAVMQIECRRKCAKKLDFFLQNPDFEFPAGVSAEQASNQFVAQYHASLHGEANYWLDMTAGLGIDAMTAAIALSETTEDSPSVQFEVTAVELDPVKAETLRRNAETLGVRNFNVVCDDSIDFLRNSDKIYDLIFIDPARREGDDKNRRVYFLEDCLPDVVSNLELIRSHARRILIKASPILDIKMAFAQLSGITEVHIVCVKGECKEVLLLIDEKNAQNSPKIVMVDLAAVGEFLPGQQPALASRFICNLDDLNRCGPLANKPSVKSDKSDKSDMSDKSDLSGISECYLYDPNAGLHKARCGERICREFEGMKQLAVDTDLFIAGNYSPDFPGRVFRIRRVLDKKSLKQLKNQAYNVMSRNYPVAAAEIAKRYGLKSGQEQFIVACRAGQDNEPILLECEKIK